MARHKIWLLKLVLPTRFGRLLTGVLLLALLLPFFYLGVVADSQYSVPALFFSLIIAYIIPIFSYITAKSAEALVELRPILQLDEQAFEQAQARLDSSSVPGMLLTIAAGGLFGLTHMSFVRGSGFVVIEDIFSNLERSMSTLGALVVWIMMTTVIVALIQQARLFARLGAQNVKISLLNTRKLLPFARISIYSSLAIIGAVALFPLIGFESGMNQLEILPGAIATVGPLVAIFIVPIWPIHRRLRSMKEQELLRLNSRIEACAEEGGGSGTDIQTMERLTPLLQYRREIAHVSTWPFDFGNIARLVLYLVIPPMTWVAAALIENVVDSLL